MNLAIKAFFAALIFAFLQGALLAFGINGNIIKASVIVFLIFSILLIYSAQNQTARRFNYSSIWIFILFTLIWLISVAVNNSNFGKSFSFFHYTLVAFLSFSIGLNLTINTKHLKRFDRTIVLLLVLQIFAAIIKVGTVGTKEMYAGTIGFTGGSLNTVYPLIGISFFTIRYFFYKDEKKYLILAIGTLFIAWAGEKRGIYFYLPVVLFLIFFLHRKLTGKILFSINNSIKGIVILLISSFIFYWGIRLSPTLNPDNTVLGRFDLNYTIEYATNYSYNEEEVEYATGRFSGLEHIVIQSLSNIESHIFYIGKGPDLLIGLGEESIDTAQDIGVSGSMAINGFSTYLLSLGLFGVLAIIILYYNVSRKIYAELFREDLEFNRLLYSYGVFALVGFFIFYLDYFTYTRSFVHTNALNMIIFITAGLFLNKSNFKVLKVKKRI